MDDHTVFEKTCTGCKTTYKDVPGNFGKLKRAKDGYNWWCKACFKKWREDNKETLKEKKAAYHQAHREEHYQRNQEWRKNNPEKRRKSDREYRARNREARNAYNRWLRTQKPEVFSEGQKRYYDRLNALPKHFTEDDWMNCLEHWQYACAVCGDKSGTLHNDHWIPVSYEMLNHPGTTPENMLPLCHSCNSSKFNKDGYLWLVDLYGKDHADTIYERIQSYFESVKVRVIE